MCIKNASGQGPGKSAWRAVQKKEHFRFHANENVYYFYINADVWYWKMLFAIGK